MAKMRAALGTLRPTEQKTHSFALYRSLSILVLQEFLSLHQTDSELHGHGSCICLMSPLSLTVATGPDWKSVVSLPPAPDPAPEPALLQLPAYSLLLKLWFHLHWLRFSLFARCEKYEGFLTLFPENKTKTAFVWYADHLFLWKRNLSHGKFQLLKAVREVTSSSLAIKGCRMTVPAVSALWTVMSLTRRESQTPKMLVPQVIQLWPLRILLKKKKRAELWIGSPAFQKQQGNIIFHLDNVRARKDFRWYL